MQFKRDQNNQYICEECNNSFKNLNSLSHHISCHHFAIKIYYDKWIKENDDNQCKICGNDNEFVGLVYGYKNGCCKDHKNKLGYEKRKQSLLLNYGVENQFQRDDLKKKMKQTWVDNYGVDNPNKCISVRNKLEQTNIKKYGTSCALANKEIKKKAENTCQLHYGVKNPYSSKIIKEKIKQTCLKKYGVENAMQNRDIFEKSFKTRILIKKYKDTDLLYQGSYELDFLNNFSSIIEIKNGLSFNYLIQDQNKIYHSDFFIPSLNLIVEIKNYYLYKKYKEEIYQKEIAVKKSNYNYILIIDKHYKKFINTYVR